MIQLIIDNSYSKITGLTASQHKELSNLLSYVVGGKSSYFSSYGPKRKSLLDKKGNLPTGLVHRVVSSLMAKKLDLDIKDIRIKPEYDAWCSAGYRLTKKPYAAQSNAAREAAIYGRGIISMPTGSGKSLVIALIASRLSVKTLIVVPSLEIKQQLTRSLLEHNGTLRFITVENIDSPRLNNLTDFGCLIIDEAHHVAAKTYQKLNKTAWKGIYYRFFLTATPYRNDTEETLLFESVAGSLIYELSYKNAVANGYIVPIESYYIESPKKENDCYTWSEVYSSLVVNNKIRSDIISLLLLTLNNNDKSTLCLVKEVKHGKILSDITGLPFVSGADDESREYIQQFNRGEIKVLIGTTGILGEGIDTRPCEYVVIAGLGKAKSQFMQQVGRAVRTYSGKESAKVILIKDKSHKFCTRHFKAQCDILKTEYGSVPIKLGVI